MATVLFISDADLKANSIVSGNVDPALFIHFIKIAQQMHVQNYLGTKLYDAITDKIINSTLTGNYLNLVKDYIQPMLIHFAMVDYLPFASFQIKNGGVYKQKSDTQEMATTQEVEFLVQKHRTFADHYAQQFIKKMGIKASTLFPEYWQNSEDDMYPDQKANPCNWVL